MKESITETETDQTTQLNPSEEVLNEGEQKEGDQVSREDRRAQHDFLRFKQEAKAVREENQLLVNKMKEMEEASLAEKQNYKELYERKNEEVNALKADSEQKDKIFFSSLKNQEIEKEALRMGIRSEALEDLRAMDQSGVITETTSTGHVNIIGAKDWVGEVKQKKGYWFKAQGAPNVNTGVPNYNNAKMSTSDILKLEKSDPAKYREEMMKILSK